MTIDHFLGLLESVRPRGAGKFSAKCPAHADTSPSLAIAEGERGLLIKCWAGCPLADICKALHLHPKELFFNSLDADPARRRAAAQERERQRRERERKAEVDGAVVDALKAATYFIESRSGLDISGWSNQRLDEEMTAVADALTILEAERNYD